MIHTPSSVTVNTGEQGTIQPQIDSFFQQVYEALCAKHGLATGATLHPYFEIRSGEIAFQPRTISDDRVSFLLFQEQVVALVMETRTQFNHVQYTFFLKDPALESNG